MEGARLFGSKPVQGSAQTQQRRHSELWTSWRNGLATCGHGRAGAAAVSLYLAISVPWRSLSVLSGKCDSGQTCADADICYKATCTGSVAARPVHTVTRCAPARGAGNIYRLRFMSLTPALSVCSDVPNCNILLFSDRGSVHPAD